MDIQEKIQRFQEEIKKKPALRFIFELLKEYPDAEVYLVGGMVRDILLERKSYDYDFVVRNVPAETLERFLEKFGTVCLVGKSFGVFKFLPDDMEIGNFIDIALPRTEKSWGTGGYKDFEVQSDPYLPIKEDLSRRDFTINSMAILINKTDSLMDLFGGIGDLEEKIIRTVGKAEKRFAEDYTRMIRATRFSAQLGFEIEEKTYLEIKNNAGNIKKVAIDLIRDEFNKIIMSSNAKRGVMLLHNLKLLRWIIPELETGVGVDQNKSHIFTVFEHAIRTLDFAAKNNYSLEIRIAGLLHDVAKPITKKGKGVDATFYNHDIVGARITRKILRRLNYSNEKIKKIEHLVRYHMFYYSLGEITDAGVRRFIARVGREHIDDLIKLRMADRIGMGRPKAKPFKLIELQRRVKLVQLDPISVKMLKVNGADIIEELGLSPCPKFGLILNALLAEVLEDPKKNDREYLIKRMKELNKMNDKELNDLSPDLDSYEEYRRKETIKKM